MTEASRRVESAARLVITSPFVKLWQELGRTRTPDGTDMTLSRRGDEYVILADGKDLMSSRMHGSEEALAWLGCERARDLVEPRVLVGGLGMGFTLRATLDRLPAGATVVVAELLGAVVDWNRGPLAPLADHPLADRRCVVQLGDVVATLRANVGGFDAILLDVDNGPRAFAQAGNSGLYDNAGLAIVRAAQRPGGVVAVWSAWQDRRFEHRLRYAGFDAASKQVRGRLKKGGPHHTIFVGQL